MLKSEKTGTDLLLAWYRENKRPLPWREDPSPYHVWLSEIMLQQTRIEAVLDYYRRFLQEVPDIAALSSIDDERLMKLWEGLGYYSRARNLKKAAVLIMKDYGGRMPADYESLLALPGIGSYTAGAISSIAFGKRQPAVDGNVLRVLSRMYGDERDISLQKTRNAVRKELLSGVLPLLPDDPALCGDFNQALMELGEVICLPNGAPRCGICPFKGLCLAHTAQRESDFPVKSKAKERKSEERTILLITDEGRLVLCKRPDKGLLAGLYEFVNLKGKLSREETMQWLKDAGLRVLHMEPLPPAKHIFSHIEWHMTGFDVQVEDAGAVSREDLSFVIADRGEAEERYPLPGAYKRYLAYYREQLCADKVDERRIADHGTSGKIT